MKRAIPYYRVSTERQGHSGLGLEAQQKSVHDFALGNGLTLITEYTEIESGKKNERPILLRAIEKCKQQNAILLMAKLDRLGRNVAFISKLMESGVDFIAVDNPCANKLIVHIMAAFAEYERDAISTRTKDALQAAKRRGVILGLHGRTVLSKANRQAANAFALKMQPIVERLQAEGHNSVRKLEKALNDRKIKTYTNSAKWHTRSVHALLKRIENIKHFKN